MKQESKLQVFLGLLQVFQHVWSGSASNLASYLQQLQVIASI